MMSWGPHPPQVKFICFVSQDALEMAAHLICIYRGLALSRHSVKLSIQNQAACNTPETVFLGVSFPYTVMPQVFNLKSMIKY